MGDREFVFDENEPIFFMTKPRSKQEYHNTPNGCNSCLSPWQKQSDLSYCEFCGISNCKKCTKGSRKFLGVSTKKTTRESQSKLNKSKDSKTDESEGRGRICKVCVRKFHIKEMVQDSSKLIYVQNLTIENALR